MILKDKIILYCSVLTISYHIIIAQMLDFSQNEYDVLMDRAEISWVNKSIFNFVNGGFVLYNRTQRVFNLSMQLLVDVGAKTILDVQVFKFTSNEYRFFPITVSVNACVEYERNTFRARDILRKVSNIDACNMQKGYYFLRNGIPDFSKFPPHLPRGLYKLQAIFRTSSFKGSQVDFYGSIKDKAEKWGD